MESQSPPTIGVVSPPVLPGSQATPKKRRGRPKKKRTRDLKGRYLPGNGIRIKARNERSYLKAVTAELTESTMAQVTAAVVQDALGGLHVDAKCTNAAREWLLKACLGGGKVPLDDIVSQPAIVRRR